MTSVLVDLLICALVIGLPVLAAVLGGTKADGRRS